MSESVVSGRITSDDGSTEVEIIIYGTCKTKCINAVLEELKQAASLCGLTVIDSRVKKATIIKQGKGIRPARKKPLKK